MRHELLIGLVTGVLVMTTTGAVAAQDDEEPQVILAAPEYTLERFEIPEAGLAMLLPVDWDVEIRMEEDEYRLPPEFTRSGTRSSPSKVVYAEDGQRRLVLADHV